MPATVGFSYTKAAKAFYDSDSGETTVINGTDCAGAKGRLCGTYSVPDESLVPNSTANAAPNFYKTLQGFMGAFPKYSRHGFHFSSESYGGECRGKLQTRVGALTSCRSLRASL
jgi:hypothetical protein